MKPFNKPSISGVLILSALACAAKAGESSVTVRVDTGNISTVAIGANALSSVNLGGMNTPTQTGCVKLRVKQGDIHKIAIGPNAKAVVQIPGDSLPCEEKKP